MDHTTSDQDMRQLASNDELERMEAELQKNIAEQLKRQEEIRDEGLRLEGERRARQQLIEEENRERESIYFEQKRELVALFPIFGTIPENRWKTNN